MNNLQMHMENVGLGTWSLELGEKDKHGLDGERYSFVLGVFDQAAGIDRGSFHP